MIDLITFAQAKQFYYLNKEKQVTLNDTGFYYGYFDENYLAGIISVEINKNIIRIKSFIVDKEYRGKGIGTALVKHIFKKENTYSVFATENSQKIFEKFGFNIVSEKKNNIKFMKYEPII